MKETKIEWCDSTWNPVTGCLHGCEYCYARKIANRFKGNGFIDIRKYNAVSSQIGEIIELKEPIQKKNKKGKFVVDPYPFNFKPTLHKYLLDKPQHWKKPRTIFVCSMADLFGDWVPDEWIEEVFDACDKAPQHRYLFLTKNSKRYTALHYADKLPKKENMSNVWLGTTVTNREQVRALDINWLPRYANTFLSVEPLIEDIASELYTELDFVKWVIIGAETGNRKDKVIPQKQWIDKIVEECDGRGIAIYMKDSLIPIVGKENMRREFPWEKGV